MRCADSNFRTHNGTSCVFNLYLHRVRQTDFSISLVPGLCFSEQGAGVVGCNAGCTNPGVTTFCTGA